LWQCGHKLVVQYHPESRYVCNYLRLRCSESVCQHFPTDPLDTAVVQAFFAALSPVELDAYQRVIAAEQHHAQRLDQAQRQQLERLHYQAALAERQYRQVDPDNRLVAAELERRWELALRELTHAEQTSAEVQHATLPAPVLSPELQAAFTAIGQRLPELWPQAVLSQPQRKALLRCLIEKVVAHRHPRDQVQLRIVWAGGDTTELAVPIPVGSWTELSNSAALEQRILALHQQGWNDAAIAAQLTAEGYRSPKDTTQVRVGTIKVVRRKHKLFVNRCQSHPRHIPGYLTVPQLAKALGVPVHWFYLRINNGTLVLTRDAATGLYLFPDTAHTRHQLEKLKAGQLQTLCLDTAR